VKRVAIVVSHPIQHFCPQYRSWTELGIAQVKVFFGKGDGATSYFDSGFQRQLSWGDGLLQGFDHEFIGASSEQRRFPTLSLFTSLSRYKPDVVVIYGYYQRVQQAAIAWSLTNGIPMAYIADSELRHEERSAKRIAKKVLVSQILRRMNIILSIGDANEKYYLSMGVDPCRLVRMHFPIDKALYDRAYANRSKIRHTERARLGLSDSDVSVLMVGKLATSKRQDDLIFAIDALVDGHIGLKLFFAGSGPQQRDYATLAGHQLNTRLLGFVDPAELPALYAAADIYAHVSSYDPHPLAVSEAIAMGLPVVCTRPIGSWGSTDDVAPFVNGFVVDVGDIGQLSHSLGLLTTSPDLRATYSRRSRARSEGFQAIAHKSSLVQIVDRI